MAHMDLHIHSSVSLDGDISPRGLAELCCQEGITLAALTDHNAVSGVPEFIWRGAQLGVRTIPAVELDCIASDVHLHILGYGIDISSAELVHIEYSVRQMEKEASHIPMRFITAEQAIEAIHASGGIAVLAHPGANAGMQDDLADKLLSLPVDGVEVFSSYHTDTTAKFYLKKAQEKKLLITGGSDFHGKNMPTVRLGQISFNGMEEILREAILASIPSHDFI